MTDGHPIGPDRFFRLEGTAFRALLPPDRPVWDVLGRLGKAIEERLRPNVASLPKPSDLVERTAVLH
ncbi:MAG: hypothetical protein ACYS47_14650, partial [Planctomycetota bacterium]